MSSSSCQGQRGFSITPPPAEQASTQRETPKFSRDGDAQRMAGMLHKASETPSGTPLCSSGVVPTVSQPAEAGARRQDDAAVMGGNTAQLKCIDVLSRPHDAGWGIKTLKEQLPESIRFGQIRLCLAHMGRLRSHL